MRRLFWMARAVQRDEWQRFGELLTLIDARVRFGGGDKPRLPVEWMPPALRTPEEREWLGDGPRGVRVRPAEMSTILRHGPGYVEG